jgi:hypothetical protein
MRTNRLMALILLVAAGCASGNTPPPSTAQVAAAITPAAGSALGRESVVQGTVEYSIEPFHKNADTYYIVTAFQDKDGKPFHHYEKLSDQPILVGAKGSVIVTYPLARVWDDPRLQRPITLWFQVVERVGPNDTAVIGSAGPFTFSAQ